MANFGEKLKKLRQDNNLSMTKVAEKLGVSRAHISLIEANKTGVSTQLLEKAANFFDVDVSYFYVEEDKLVKYTDDEREILFTKNLTVNELKEKYNLVVDNKGTIATDEEIEKAIEYINVLRELNKGKTNEN